MIDVYKNGESGYKCIRIPALLRTQADTILAFAEARKLNCNDHGSVDLVVKRSHDNGLTWSTLEVIQGNSNSTDPETFGNAAPVQDRTTGEILLIFCRNNAQVLLTKSSDDGATWSPPTTLSNVVKPHWKWVATGPPGAL